MKILYHLGYPRTGSTYLQTNIFPKHKDINLIGPKNYKNWNDVKISQEELNNISNQFFDIELNDKQKILSEKKYLKFFDQSKLNVISSEKYASYLNIRNNFRGTFRKSMRKHIQKSIRFNIRISIRFKNCPEPWQALAR